MTTRSNGSTRRSWFAIQAFRRQVMFLNAVLGLGLCAYAVEAAPITGGTGPGGIGTVGAANDLVLWLRGDAGIVFDAGTNVQAWNDQSGRGNNALQAVAADQPNQSISFNTIPVLTFPGGPGDRLEITAVSGLSGISNGSMVGMYDSNDVTLSDQVAFASQIGGNSAYPRVEKYTADGTHRWLTGADPGAWRYGAGSTVTQTPQVYLTTYDGTQALDANRQTMRIDGTSYVTTPGGASPAAASNPVISTVKIGSWVNDGFNFNGNIGEIAVYNRTINAAEQQIAENYVSSKFNITIAGASDHYAGDTVGNGNYDFGVFGIGNTGTASLTSTGHAGLGIENASIGSGEWVLAGHNNGPNGVTPPVTYGGQLWERSWFIDTTGVATANLYFDWNDAGVSAAFDAGFNGLFYRPNLSSAFVLIAVGTVDIGNQRVDFLNAPLNPLDGFYTLGSVPVPEPSTLTLLGLGGLGLVIKRRRRG